MRNSIVSAAPTSYKAQELIQIVNENYTSCLTWALKELEQDCLVEITTRDYYGFSKKDYKSLRQPAPGSLTNTEIELLADVIDFVCARSAREISELSHTIAWVTAAMGEDIPYFTVLGWLPGEVTEYDFGIR